MNATKKPSKIMMPPVLNTSAMLDVINKGGSVTASASGSEVDTATDTLKSFTFKIYESELAQIRAIQARLPKRDRQSIHDFVLEAVKQKIKKEQELQP